jgi:glycosyltransferase involved in cell wall biosynthesis
MTPPPTASADPLPAGIDVSVVVTTYRKPRHLALVLESLALQESPGCGHEIVVSDDGSTDDTASVVAAFARRSAVPVRFVSQPHDGFRLARVRNAAARLARGRYLVFLDGDCLAPRGHLAAHVARRRPGTALLGFCARLPEDVAAGLDAGHLAAVDLERIVPARERRSLAHRRWKAWWYAAIRHPTKPRLAGGDFGLWKSDFDLVNGFDERFVGWGQEDDDLGLRLRAAGVRLESILGRTATVHVWHPTDPSAGRRWRDGPNVRYFHRRGRLTACRRGLVDRTAAAVRWGLPADVLATRLGRAVAAELSSAPVVPPGEPCEIDVILRPGTADFRRPAECRLAIAEDVEVEPAVAARADRVARLAAGDRQSLARLLEEVG